MALGLRLSGWALFLLGAGIFLSSGGFSDPKNLLAWIGLFTALLGMLLTSASNLAAALRQVRRTPRPPGPGRPPSPPVE